MTGYLLYLTRHFTKFTTTRFVLESIGEFGGVVLCANYLGWHGCSTKLYPQVLF